MALATSGLLILILGQLFDPSPDTHLMTKGGESTLLITLNPAENERRLINFPGGVAKAPLKDLPHIGPLDAPHILVKYFDYTCDSCRTMHEHLNQLQATYPGKVTVVYLITPLNRACNPYLSPRIRDHDHACELANLSLAVWKARPDKFEAVHQKFFTRPILTESAARSYLKKECPDRLLNETLADP